MDLSIIIPVHNEAGSLTELHDRIDHVWSQIPGSREIIYVDDASADGSRQVLSGLCSEWGEVRVIPLAQRSGQSGALCAGFVASRGEWIVIMDADLQNPPEEIVKLWQSRDAADYVVGHRMSRRDTWTRQLGSWLAFAARFVILNDHIRDAGCSLKLCRREVLKGFPFSRNAHCFMSCWAQWRGFRCKVVPVSHAARRAGRSNYSLWTMGWEGWEDLWRFRSIKQAMIEEKV
jgi:glycosyltransferase involved in cell wall biosynthesis